MPGQATVTRDLVVVGGSAGSLTVLQSILRALPGDFPAAILVVVHQGDGHQSRLPDMLGGGPLPIALARDGEPIEIGRVYIGPPDHHMLVEPGGHVRLSRGPKQNRFRPAIDPLFRTAARVYGPQVIGVILSGLLDDGTFGLMQVTRFGGVGICQDPRDAEAPDMPASAIRHARPEYVLKSSEIADTLNRLAREPGSPRPSEGATTMSERRTPTVSVGIPSETGDIADRGDNALNTGSITGPPSKLTCPECGGALWERDEQGMLFYRCHVGHSYTAQSMAAEHGELLEQTLWEALRMFEETAHIHRRVAERRSEDQPELARRFTERAAQMQQRSELIRRILLGEAGGGEGGGGGGPSQSEAG